MMPMPVAIPMPIPAMPIKRQGGHRSYRWRNSRSSILTAHTMPLSVQGDIHVSWISNNQRACVPGRSRRRCEVQATNERRRSLCHVSVVIGGVLEAGAGSVDEIPVRRRRTGGSVVVIGVDDRGGNRGVHLVSSSAVTEVVFPGSFGVVNFAKGVV